MCCVYGGALLREGVVGGGVECNSLKWWRHARMSFFLIINYIAYLPVHSRASFVYFSRSVL